MWVVGGLLAIVMAGSLVVSSEVGDEAEGNDDGLCCCSRECGVGVWVQEVS